MGRSVMMGVGNEDTCLLRSCVLCIPCSVMEHVGYLSIKYTLDRRSHLTSLVGCHHTSITFVWRLVSRCVFAAINFVPSRFHVWLLGCVRPAPRQTTNPLRLVFSLRLSLRGYYFLCVCVWVLFLSFQSCSGDCIHTASLTTNIVHTFGCVCVTLFLLSSCMFISVKSWSTLCLL